VSSALLGRSSHTDPADRKNRSFGCIFRTQSELLELLSFTMAIIPTLSSGMVEASFGHAEFLLDFI